MGKNIMSIITEKVNEFNIIELYYNPYSILK